MSGEIADDDHDPNVMENNQELLIAVMPYRDYILVQDYNDDDDGSYQVDQTRSNYPVIAMLYNDDLKIWLTVNNYLVYSREDPVTNTVAIFRTVNNDMGDDMMLGGRY
jgi:hypothetical protein